MALSRQGPLMRAGRSHRCVFFVSWALTRAQPHATTHAQLHAHKHPHIQVTYRHIGKQAKHACIFPHPRCLSFSELACGFKSTDKGSGAPWCPIGSAGWALFCWFAEAEGGVKSAKKGDVVIPLKVGWFSHARTHTHPPAPTKEATPTHPTTRTCSRTHSPSTSLTSMN